VSDFRTNNASPDSVAWRLVACHSDNNVSKDKILLSILPYIQEKLLVYNSTKHMNQGGWVCTISMRITTKKTIFLPEYLCALMP